MRTTFALRADPGRKAELRGDFPDFRRAHAASEVEPGRYEITLDLAPGVYRYKFVLDGKDWVISDLDPQERLNGYENNVRVVSGVEQPIRFAPDERHLSWDRNSGAVSIHAHATGPGVPESFRVWSDHPTDLPVVRLASNPDLLRASGQITCAPTQIEMPGVGSWEWPPHGTRETSGWWQDAVFYTILIDRWHRGRWPEPSIISRKFGFRRLSRRRRLGGLAGRLHGGVPSAATRYGGDLWGVLESLPRLRDLGIDALVLSPLCPSPSAHRYDATDLLSIDPDLGGESAFRSLRREAHALGLRVVVDFSSTHVSDRHPAFQDVLRYGRSSRFFDWFQTRSDHLLPRDPTTYAHYPGGPGLPLLRHESSTLRAHLVEAAGRWADRGADGLRLDALEDVPLNLWAEVRARVKSQVPDFLLLGETLSDRLHKSLEVADLATDFVFREHVVRALGRGVEVSEIARNLETHEHQVGPTAQTRRLLFLDNLDTPRFRSLCVTHDKHRLALLFLLMQPGPIGLTYGAELGLAGGSPEHQREHVWAERLPMPREVPWSKTADLISTVAAIRRALGPVIGRRAHDSRWIVDRAESPSSTIRAILNVGPQTVTLAEEVPSDAVVLFSTNPDPTSSCASLAPWQACIVRCTRKG